jgi:ribosomal RNA assembly protein|tara:strand:- start:3049 stop:3594 length:546 start_codon:yes stop_codon:yes gene_type:complete
MQYTKVPLSRVAVLIGKKGKVKIEIEKRLGVSLNINNTSATVSIENKGGDELAEWRCKDIVRAIGKGFSPQNAMKLCKEDYSLAVINLEDIVGRSDKALKRQKGRVIGREGKTRRYIEESTKALISIYGKSVAIIGTYEEIQVAKKGIVMLASGSPHGVVYKTLQFKARELKERRFHLWEE